MDPSSATVPAQAPQSPARPSINRLGADVQLHGSDGYPLPWGSDKPSSPSNQVEMHDAPAAPLPTTAPPAELPLQNPAGDVPVPAEANSNDFDNNNANGHHAAGHDAPPTDSEVGMGTQPSSDGNISPEDIQLVQNLIERCLQMYMAREEVVNTLKAQASIDPDFTQLVWTKLEEQNADFFRCYYTRLKLKAQIIMFNHLLEQQVSVVQRMQRGWGVGSNASAVPGTTAHGTAAGGLGPAGSATASGIPLFQGGGAKQPMGLPGGKDVLRGMEATNGGESVVGSGEARQGGDRDQVVPTSGGGGSGGHRDFSFHLPAGMDVSGPSPLFGGLAHIDSEQDLANLASSMPTPGELQNALGGLMAGLSPLNMPSGGGQTAALPRNFSLSDLGLYADGPSSSLPRNFSLEGLDAAAGGGGGGGANEGTSTGAGPCS